MHRLKGLLLAGSIAAFIPGVLPGAALDPLSLPQDSLTSVKSAAIEEQLRGRPDAALDLYQRAVQMAAQEFGTGSSYVGDLFFEMGSLAFDTHRFQQAEDYLSRAVQINPTSPTARAKLAELMLVRGRPEEAKALAEQALRHHGDSVAARKALARAMQDLKSPMNPSALADPAGTIRAFAHLNAVVRGKPAPVPLPPPPPKPSAPPPPEPKPEPPAEPPKKEEKPKPKPPEKPKQAPKPVPKPPPKPPEKPKPAPKADKPAAPAKPKTEELKAEPAKLQPKPASTPKPKKAPGGLVPPPPPVMPVFPGAPMVPPPPPMEVLRTDAKVRKEPAKPKEPPPKEEKPAPSSGGDDSDFLLDWAADKGGKKK